MADDDDALTPPESDSTKELVSAATRVGAGYVPLAGPMLSEALAHIINAPLQRRVHSWREEVMRRIKALEISESSLEDNENFASAVVEAQMAVMRSNAEEKREALANAVLNVALDRGPDEDRQQMFMAYIAELTPWHLRLLVLMSDPPGVLQQIEVDISNISMGGLSILVEGVYPELNGQKEFYKQLANDLNNRGLLSDVGFNVTMSGGDIVAKRTTNAGDEFIRFVSAPHELADDETPT